MKGLVVLVFKFYLRSILGLVCANIMIKIIINLLGIELHKVEKT